MTIAARTAAVHSRMSSKFGSINVRHHGDEYTCPSQSLQSIYQGDGIALVQGTTGAARILVADMIQPYPALGDDIEVQDQISSAWDDFTVLDVSPQNAGITMLVQYGAKYGS